MATVTYTRTYSYSNVSSMVNHQYFYLNASSFTAPSGYTWSYSQFTCTNGQLTGNTPLSVTIRRGNQALVASKVNWSAAGAKTYTYTDAVFGTAAGYQYGTQVRYYYSFWLDSNSGTTITITNPKFIIAFKKTFNVTKGNKILKTDFDAIGWSATVGQPIKHSGMSGTITASGFNALSTTINEAITGTYSTS